MTPPAIKAQRDAARRYAEVMITTASQNVLMRLYYERLLLALSNAKPHVSIRPALASPHLRQAQRILEHLILQFRSTASADAVVLLTAHEELLKQLQYLFLRLQDNPERMQQLQDVLGMHHKAWDNPLWNLPEPSDLPVSDYEA